MTSICLYCGASQAASSEHLAFAREFGRATAEGGHTLVYGGGRVGLMGAAADAALDAGGRVVGLIPRTLVDLEVAHDGVELEIVEDFAERKDGFWRLSDVFVALPGGTGTMEEIFDTITRIRYFGKQSRIILAPAQTFWAPLIKTLTHLAEADLAPPVEALFEQAETPEQAVERAAAVARRFNASAV
ncbi:MAG: TIGR00730 family Rossman fold protein [Maricaulaceae bacterium]